MFMSARQQQLKILEQGFNGKKDNHGNPIYIIKAQENESVVEFSLLEESMNHNNDYFSSGRLGNEQRPYIITVERHKAVKIIPSFSF